MISLCKVHVRSMIPKIFGLREPILRSISAMLGIGQLASGVQHTYEKYYLMIPCLSKVSIVTKSAASFLGFCARGGALFRATLHSRSFTVSWNSGILAGAAGNSLLKISLNSLHNVRNRCRRSLSPDIWISDKTSVVDGDGNHGLNVSVLSWSISLSWYWYYLDCVSESRGRSRCPAIKSSSCISCHAL